MGGLVIRPGARVLRGHQWVHSGEVIRAFGEVIDGEVVELRSKRDRFLGSAIYNSKSKLIARRFSYRKEKLDRDSIRQKITAAILRRLRIFGKIPFDFHSTNAELEAKQVSELPQLCRLIWSESDNLPGLIVDKYDDKLVIQTSSLAMDRRQAIIIEELTSLLSPIQIIERNDIKSRLAEGLQERKGIIYGDQNLSPILEAEVHKAKFIIDLINSQKTGFYLDQLDNYPKIAAYAKDRRVLDCFCHSGAFGLNCLLNGAKNLVAVDSSATALELLTKNARLNKISTAKLETVNENVFDYLKMQARLYEEKEKAGADKNGLFDLIILDPPSFAPTKNSLQASLRAIKEIHLRALKILRPGALLVSFSCSHRVDQKLLLECVAAAANDAKRKLCRREQLEQRADHPILLCQPESQYLTGFVHEVLWS